MKILPKYLVGREKLICKILKSLYGLKKVKKLWKKMITKRFQKIDFTFTNTDSLYILIINYEDELIIRGIYVDNLLLK